MMRFSHGGNVYEEESPTGKWLDFSANINPLGLPNSARQAIISSMADIACYPDPKARKLKAAVAEHYDVPVEQIILGNGATELFYLLFFVMRFSRALIAAPAFGEYERAALAAQTPTEFLPLKQEDGEFRLPTEKIAALLNERSVLVVGNPNNPTGNLITLDEREKILAAAKKSGAWIIADESFLDFLGQAGQKYSFKPSLKKHSRLIVVHSLTKFFALPGLRLGFAVAAPDTAERLEAAKDVWNVNTLAQAAGVAALSDKAYQEQSTEFILREKEFLANSLRQFANLQVFAPTVNFIFFKITDDASSAEIAAQMRSRGILVRDCANYRALNGEHIRVAVRTRDENLRLVASLRECLQ